MIQGYFHSFEGAVAVRSSGHHSDLIVQPFGGATGDFAFGLEAVHQQVLMGAQHSRNFLHRRQPTAQGPFRPDPQEVTRPSGGTVVPEGLEGLLEDPRSGGGQFAGNQVFELLAGFATHPTAASQQFPPHPLEWVCCAEAVARKRLLDAAKTLVEVLKPIFPNCKIHPVKYYIAIKADGKPHIWIRNKSNNTQEQLA